MGTGPTLRFGKLDFPLNKITNTIGRKDRITNLVPDVDLGTLDQERSVSRRHAEIAYDHGVISLRDVGSVNGSTVNGERLAHQVDRQLNDGDEVGFGAVAMSYIAEAEWPEGVEAEWPPEVPEATPEETMIAGPGPEETMVAGPMAEETMVSPPADASETAVFAPGGFETAEMPAALPFEAPADAEEEPTAAEAAPEPEPAPEPEAAAAPTAPPEPEPMAAAVPEVVEAYVACANHSHLPAVGLCPGCLEPFCVDCLPEREDGLMVCNRCAGISYRLAVAVQAVPAPSAGASSYQAAAPQPSPFPEPFPAPAAAMPQPAPPPMPGAAPAPDGDKKKRWPF